MNSKIFKKIRLSKPVDPVFEIAKLKYANSPRVRNNPDAIYEFFHPSVNRFPKFPVHYELNEFHNIYDFKSYTNENYKNFLINIKKSDDLFNDKNDKIDEVVKSCKSSFTYWEEFINNVIKDDEFNKDRDYNREYKIYNLFKKLYTKLKPINSRYLPSEEFMRLHYEFVNDSTELSLDIPFNRYNLLLMVHPHWGYFSKFEVS